VATEKKPLYEIIAQKQYGGAKIRFFEIISNPQEFGMIKNDPDLKNKVKPDDILNANFLLLNMGEKLSGGYSISIDKVEETGKNIIVTIKEKGPAPDAIVTTALTNPYTVVKINSKKEIIIK
jgi:hypothetical protein